MSHAPTRMIFVNLPVADLPRSRAFFAELGFEFNENFSNDDAACMVVSDCIFVMLLTRPFFQKFSAKPVADAHASSEVITSLTAESREAVDRMLERSLAAGASEPLPAQDLGFMYQRGFQDLDGHLWEYAFMESETD